MDLLDDKARKINKEIEIEQKRLAKLICSSYKQIAQFPVETLQQVVKLLMLED